MEGGAKGQVGGMEMADGERKRLAAESKGWKCAGCGGRSNEEVLVEEEKRSKEWQEQRKKKEGEVTGKERREEVPKELRFGFRDEMGDGKSEGKGKEKVVGQAEEELKKERQGSQHFAGPLDLKQSTSPVNVPLVAPSPKGRPPTSELQQRATQAMASSTDGTASDGVPAWVDKAIAGVIGGLLIMLIKKIL